MTVAHRRGTEHSGRITRNIRKTIAKTRKCENAKEAFHRIETIFGTFISFAFSSFRHFAIAIQRSCNFEFSVRFYDGRQRGARNRSPATHPAILQGDVMGRFPQNVIRATHCSIIARRGRLLTWRLRWVRRTHFWIKSSIEGTAIPNVQSTNAQKGQGKHEVAEVLRGKVVDEKT